jgi:cell division protein FtsI (penicillin-binding protein 3)
MPDAASGAPAALRAPSVAPQVQPRANGSVVVDAGARVAVPSFTGFALRKVVETASGLGLRVEPVGSGLAREQAPAAGTMVPLGTEVVVRFSRERVSGLASQRAGKGHRIGICTGLTR